MLKHGSVTMPSSLFYFPTVILQRPCSVCVDIRHAVCDQQWRETVRAVPTICGSLLPSLQHPPEKRQPLPQPVCFGENYPSFILIQCFTCIFIHSTNLPKKICKKDVLRTLQINTLKAKNQYFYMALTKFCFDIKIFR